MNKLPLTLAISDYDHVRDLTTGRVTAEGIDLTALDLEIEEIFYRFLFYREWDVSELGMGKYCSMVSQDDRSITALPVFPSRIFRHSSIYVRRDGPVRAPADLAGRRVGLPEWAQTASIYTKGMLAHQYGVDLCSIDWVQAGVNEAGRVEKVALRLPDGLRLSPAPEKNLSDMLVSGEVDAILTARPPACFSDHHPNVRRLFENYLDLETEYFRQTGIFPIMHTVAIRREILDRAPWAARNLLTAFEEAKRRSVARSLDIRAPRFPIPWCYEHAERSHAIFGEDCFPYGIDANRPTLEAFLQYGFEQGVCHRQVAVEELFPPQLLTSVKI